MQPEDFMRAAIAEARASQTPYGAVIVRDGKIVERSGNTVEPDSDPSAHAEVNVIRKLASRLQEPFFGSGYTLYSTCEPCPMCAATCTWAGLSSIIFGVGNDDFPNGDHPNLVDIRCVEIVERSPKIIRVEGGLLKTECMQLHATQSTS